MTSINILEQYSGEDSIDGVGTGAFGLFESETIESVTETKNGVQSIVGIPLLGDVMVEVAYSNFVPLSNFTNAAWQISYAASLQAAWSGADSSPDEWGVSTFLVPDFIYSHFEADYNGHTQFEGLDNLAFFGDNARAPSVSSDYAVKIDFKDSLSPQALANEAQAQADESQAEVDLLLALADIEEAEGNLTQADVFREQAEELQLVADIQQDQANELQALADEAPPYDFTAGGLVPDTSLDLDFSALLNEAHVVGGYSGDNIIGTELDDVIWGDETSAANFQQHGQDNILGGAGNDFIHGNAGSDTIRGGTGDDVVRGGKGDDFLFGGDIDPSLPSGKDTMFGGLGNDTLFGEDGDDTMWGDTGSTRRFEEHGNDMMFAGAGNDFVNGNAGDDEIYGEDGDDTLGGGKGSDKLDGGQGADIVYGGLGSDTAHWFFEQLVEGNDEYNGGNRSRAGDDGNTDTLVLHFTQSELDALDVDEDADPIQDSIISWFDLHKDTGEVNFNDVNFDNDADGLVEVFDLDLIARDFENIEIVIEESAFQAGQVWMDDPSQGIAGEWDEGDFLLAEGFNGIINDNSLTLGEDAVAAENAFANYDILNSDSSNNIVDPSGAISLSVEDNSAGETAEYVEFKADTDANNFGQSLRIGQNEAGNTFITAEESEQESPFPQDLAPDQQNLEFAGLLISDDNIDTATIELNADTDAVFFF